MASQKVNVTFPTGRIVMGSLYKPNTTDAEGKPLVVKNGPNAGQPRVNFFFALAIKKGPETHWAQTAWGAEIWKVGHTAFPQAAQSPTFAWKIEDGDSATPNKKGRKNCDNEGWAGHWIVKFSGGMAPKVYRPEGSGFVQVMEPDYVKPGYFVEVAGNIDSNNSQSQPGIYVNHSMVCFRAYGPEISFGPNVEDAGFGKSPLPAGASAVPPASTLPPPAAPTPAATPSPVLPPPVPVVPNTGFLQVPAPPAAVPPASVTGPVPPAIPSPVPAAPAPPIASVPPASPSNGLQMTAAANGVTYAAYQQAGWSDAQMIAAGVARV